MSAPPDDPSKTPWPYWMLRYIATDDENAFENLVWSVGGSPPYGGVSYEEASAVYDLLEDYRGPGEASPKSYAAVRGYLEGHSERLDALEAFSINDQITSAPQSFTADVVDRGSKLAAKLGHDGLRCLFLAYDAQLAHRLGNVARARDLTVEALKLGLSVAAEDSAYTKRIAQLAQNAISLTALAGDRDAAMRMQTQFGDLLDPNLSSGD
jgi:hypothetical protein